MGGKIISRDRESVCQEPPIPTIYACLYVPPYPGESIGLKGNLLQRPALLPDEERIFTVWMMMMMMMPMSWDSFIFSKYMVALGTRLR